MFVYHIAQRLSLPPFEQDDCRVVLLESNDLWHRALDCRNPWRMDPLSLAYRARLGDSDSYSRISPL